ncbi:ABC transporter ATP-binding protein [Neobacillus drentensis]|uniref:ABC transporter ATP-binding protein n=1 Tax=Neobacillus drentensis TaxID=220684 RepID=UPI00300008EA
MQLEQINIQINETVIIKDLDLQIKPKEIFVLMGPSGSGKTTLLKGIAGLIPFTAGKQTWESGKGTTGIVFQEPRLFPHLTVIENIAFGLRVKGTPVRERNNKASAFLKRLQLDQLEDRYPHQLSGGQQQRVALGRALILSPTLLLLDEPFASLDTSLRTDLIDWMYSLQRKLGFSILWVTHYLDEALSVADRIGVMLDGRLQQIAAPVELFQHPSSENIAQFLSLPNRMTRLQWSKWFKGEIKVPATKNMGWIDPNHMQIVHGEHKQENITNDRPSSIITAVVTKVKPSKEGFSVTVSADNLPLDINMIGWGRIPRLEESVKIKIPFEKILWYTK